MFDPSHVGVEDAFIALEEHLHKLRTIAAAVCDATVRHQASVRAYERTLLEGEARRVVITNAPQDLDLPTTKHVEDVGQDEDGRPVRKVSIPESSADAQIAAYTEEGCFVCDEAGWCRHRSRWVPVSPESPGPGHDLTAPPGIGV